MIHPIRKLVISALLAALTAAVAAILAFASPAPHASASDGVQKTTADALQPVVENFEYPDADRIFEETGMTLHKGDGHILFAECDDSPEQIQVWTVLSSTGKYCFRTTAATGYLTLEVPDVYALKTGERAIHAELSAEGKSQEVNVPKDKFQGVGEGLGGAPTVLLEIRVTG
ncbi:hypothetical protein [Streptomyces sp. NPDC006012]|uniref:hypothetical protein n=1 Tax=Streptomyces sp. NPDC006012 TaxID=3364739 RepID=UPI00369BBF36